MSALLDTLRELQELDREILRYRRYQRELPAEVESRDHELKEIDRLLAARQAEKKESAKKLLHEEGELKTHEGRIDKLRGQQNEVKTNREFKAFQNEIAVLVSERGQFEERILDILNLQEGIDTEIKALEERRRAKEREVEAARKRAESEAADLEGKIAGLGGRRSGIARGVDAKTLSLYEELLENKNGLALASVASGACQGCNFKVPPNVLNMLHKDSDLVKCTHCGRFLFLVDR
ncbi:MAG: hypothetical protein HY720_13755 [Planctomycetes bacterium]|nr:hypothetical protein [Planctomycetota bacterium]